MWRVTVNAVYWVSYRTLLTWFGPPVWMWGRFGTQLIHMMPSFVTAE